MNLGIFRIKRFSSLILMVVLAGQAVRCDAPTAAQLAEFKEQYDQLIAQQKAHQTAIANSLLASKPSVFDQINKKKIISDNERYELQCLDLVRLCGKPETSFGPKGMEWLLIPVADDQEIKRRQGIIRALMEDSKLFDQLQEMLQEIEKSEAAVITYWDKQSELMQRFSQFYYKSFFALNKPFNKSSAALNLGACISLYEQCAYVVDYFLLGAIIGYIQENGLKNFRLWGTKDPDGKDGVLNHIFRSPLHKFSPQEYLYQEEGKDPRCATCGKGGGAKLDPNQSPTVNVLAAFLGSGTLGDRMRVIREWFAKSRAMYPVRWAENEASWPGLVTKPAGYVVGPVVGIGAAVLSSYIAGVVTYDAAIKVKTYWKEIFILRANLKKVATFIRSLEKFEKVISASPALANAKTNRYLTHVMNKNHWSDDLRKLVSILDSSMFNESQKLFLPGQMFAAHTLMQEVKGELVPAMQAIAEFDAYLSLAKLMKEHQNTPNTYTFVEFVDQETPVIYMDGAWTPFVGAQQAVSNPVALGIDGNPTRMVITGPNGGGKSIYFTALGQAVLMAHSWGIVPARSARMTYFNQIRTSFAPKEDKLHGISKFMAQKRHISAIERLMATSNASNKMLVLLDEPFDGTTEHLMAERVYDFGLKVKQLPYVVVGIATHVKKPIELAYDGSFKNYHVGIEEPELGIFERTFKLVEGPAEWWFSDQKRGARYQDWLDIYMQRHAAVRTAPAA